MGDRPGGGIIRAVAAEDASEALGVDNRADAAMDLRARKIEKLIAAGVIIEDPSATYVEDSVEVGPTTTIRPNTYLEGNTRIGSGCTIGPLVQIADSTVGDQTQVGFSKIVGAEIGNRCNVGPFASIRPGTKLADGAKIGTFVEAVRSTIGEGSKVPHLSYVGDTEIGRDANIGAGTITGNYDGETGKKSRTLIKDEVLTGSGTTIVAPATLGKGAVTAAGSVVTQDVEDEDVVMGVPARRVRKRKPRPPKKG